MATLASVSTTLDHLTSLTYPEIRKVIIDQVYGSNPFIARLLQRNNVMLSGATDIRVPILFAEGLAASYAKGATFNTQLQDDITSFVFPWRRYVSPVTIDKVESLLNSGPSAVLDFVSAKLQNAELSMRHKLGTDVYLANGGGNGLDGLAGAVDDSTNNSSYGGITYSSTAGEPGNVIKANLDTTGGTFSYKMVNDEFGNATVGGEAPDLILTTQAIWNSFWAKAVPAQRYPQTGAAAEMAKIGFRTIDFNGAAVIADSHCPASTIYGLNTKYFQLFVHKDRNFVFEGWFESFNSDVMHGRILWLGNLVCLAPRLQMKIESVTAL